MRKVLDETSEVYKKILEVRDLLYNECVTDLGASEVEILDYIKKQYDKTDTNALCDSIVDILLDSFGS